MAGAPACLCLHPGAPETWPARTPVEEAALVSLEDQACHAMPHVRCIPHCKSLRSVLRWLMVSLEREFDWNARLVCMSETQQTLMCSFGFCAS